MRAVGFLSLLLCLAACGGDDASSGGGAAPTEKGGGGGTAKAAPKTHEDLKRDLEALDARMVELKQARRETARAFKQARREQDALLEKHTAERRELSANIMTIQLQARRTRAEANNARGEIARIEKRLEALSGAAGSGGELSRLRKERDKIESKLDDAIFDRRKATVEGDVGVVEESPVARELRSLGVMQGKWFEMTAEARANGIEGAARKKLGDAYRAWLKEDDTRQELARRALARAPEGQRDVGKYDFSSLDFFLLCQLLEAELDKRNIERAKKEGEKLKKLVNGLEAEIRELDKQIENLEEGAGGEDLTEYAELQQRLKGRKSAQKYAEKKAQQWELQLKPYADMEKRHATELEQSEERVKQVKAAATKAYKDLKGVKEEREALVAKIGPASG